MKIKILVLLLSITLLACHTTRSAKETISKTTQQSDSSKTDFRFTENNLEQIEKITGEWSAKLTTYDTTLPTDKTTGKPPVKCELQITNISQSEIKTAEKANTNIIVVSESATKSEYKVQEYTHSTQQSNYWWVWFLVGIVISILLFLAWKFIPND